MLASTDKYWIKDTSSCSLKYEDLKNEDCSLTYPNLKEKRKANRRGVGVTRHITPYRCLKIQQVA